MKVKRILGIAVTLGLTVTGYASETDHGIRITAGVGPGLEEYDAPGTNENLDGDLGAQIEVLYQRRHWSKSTHNFAWIWGAGLMVGNSSGTLPDGNEVKLSTFSALGQGGIAHKIGDALIIELQPYLGLGASNVELTGFTDGGASYVMYGIKGGLFIPITDSFEIGIELGYQGSESKFELDYFNGLTEDVTVSGKGVHGAGVLNVKF